MTYEQLHALRVYISTRINYAIERRLNPDAPPIPQWEIDTYEKRFEEIMLDPGVKLPPQPDEAREGSHEQAGDEVNGTSQNPFNSNTEERRP